MYYIPAAVYYIPMVQPKTPPLSARLQTDLIARVDAWAAAAGVTRNAAIGQLLELGLMANRAPRTRSEPMIDPNTGKQHTFGGVGLHVDVPIGPQVPAPGSRLKGAKR